MKLPGIRYGAAVGVLAVLSATGVSLGTTPASARTGAGGCVGSTAPLSVEESRLSWVLPDNDDPSTPQSASFADQMIKGGGFQGHGPEFTRRLCRTRDLEAATALVRSEGEALWRAAVARAQRKGRVTGALPYSDDRPLYWTRLQSTATLRRWTPGFALSGTQRSALITAYDRASRGMFDIRFPTGRGVRRVIVSGFDPYTLDGGTTGSAPGTVGDNIRHGNPSGATALALDGTTYRTKDGRTAEIQAYTLPVNYTEFQQGYLEDTVGPYMRPGPRRVDASITVSQAGDSVFDLE
ncbi:hypothetical protein [Actinoallomurus iriomotensis]|uniref:Uncharacterized protein n=1 Tax=Actinoallomurus iriomotensis TaxID=478107 RepID=A0A9W6S5P2_9ACTN|nr:hypothetical protein [Actinoallomurus iriomotensis]GLY87618.1 hypothetical protein Airi02_055470 [Actinoallomurus iriomotensis]